MSYLKSLVKKLVVIGGNAAGAAAAAKAKRENPDAEVILYEQGDYISVGSCELPYLINGEIDDYRKLVFFDPLSFEKEKGVKVRIKSRITGIDRKLRIICFEHKGERFTDKYDKLVLATGSIASVVPEASGFNNSFSFKSIPDYMAIKDGIESARHKRICILGAGLTGLELVEVFSKIGFEVILIEKGMNPLTKSEPEIQQIFKEYIIEKGIRLYYNSPKYRFFANNNNINKISIDGYLIDIDFVVSAVGFKPNSSLAAECGLEIGKYGEIRVNNKLQTTDPNIYAAGDCCAVKDFVSRRDVYSPLAIYARKMGYVAGMNAAGGNAFFEPVVKNIALRFFDYALAEVGILSNEALACCNNVIIKKGVVNNLVKIMPGSAKLFGKVILDKDGRLIGGSFLGGREVTGLADIVSFSIKQKLRFEDLQKVDFNYTPQLSPFIHIFQVMK